MDLLLHGGDRVRPRRIEIRGLGARRRAIPSTSMPTMVAVAPRRVRARLRAWLFAAEAPWFSATEHRARKAVYHWQFSASPLFLVRNQEDEGTRHGVRNQITGP
jgi:hypothetical protein